MWYRIWEGIAQQDSSGSIYGYAIFRAWFSFACGLTGRGHEARKLGEEALEFGRNHAQRLFEQMSLTALALAASLEITPDWEAVQRHMAEALRVAEEVDPDASGGIGSARVQKARLLVDLRRAYAANLSRDWSTKHSHEVTADVVQQERRPDFSQLTDEELRQYRDFAAKVRWKDDCPHDSNVPRR